MKLSDTPELRDKVEALQTAARDLLASVQPYQDRGVSPIDTMQLAYVVAAEQISTDVLEKDDDDR